MENKNLRKLLKLHLDEKQLEVAVYNLSFREDKYFAYSQ